MLDKYGHSILSRNAEGERVLNYETKTGEPVRREDLKKSQIAKCVWNDKGESIL